MAHTIGTSLPVVDARPEGDVQRREIAFVADLARWMQAKSFHRGRRIEGAEHVIRERIASGTLDGALWVLGVTDLPPVSHTSQPQPSEEAVRCERDFGGALRDRYDRSDPEWLYLGGVLDLLDFTLGRQAPFWWVPLPERTRQGPPARDIYGREID